MQNIHSLSLLAETHLAEVSLEYREEVTDGGISGWWFLLIPIALAIVAGIVYRLLDRSPRIVNTPMGLLHELCRAHRVKGRSRVLLERIAEASEMAQPATIFLGRSHFEYALKAAGKNLQLDKKDVATLGLLRRRLFSIN